MKVGNQPFQRSANLALVLRELRKRPGTTRTELSVRLGLDKSTISHLTAELIGTGLVIETQSGASSPRGGRRPVALELVDRRLLAAGIEIEPDCYRAVVVDNAGVVVRRQGGEADASRGFSSELRRIVSEVLEQVRFEDLQVLGLGIAVPGYVDPHRGRIIRSRSLGVSNIDMQPLTAEIAEGLAHHSPIGLPPLLIDNDANCCAWGELHAARGLGAVRDMLFIHARKSTRNLGIGMGVITGGELQYGSSHSAGEFHSADWQGGEMTQLGLSAEELRRIDDDPQILDQFLSEVLCNLSPIVSVLDPAAVYFGGELRAAFPRILHLLDTKLADRYMALRRENCDLRCSTYGEDEVAVGAAGMFIERLFALPRFGRGADSFTVSWDDVLPFVEQGVGA